MKPNSLSAFVVLLALGILTSGAVEGASKEKAKHGVCPFVPPVMCFVYEPPQCHNDWQCPKKQKCCRGHCGIKCLDPEDPSKPVKVNPGKCPVVTGQCKRPNPTDYCLNDSHCMLGDKCCKGVCGKSCVKPVKGGCLASPCAPFPRPKKILCLQHHSLEKNPQFSRQEFTRVTCDW
ncbi:antileukoproteinase-like [Diceros bicornis minor]|uniref:antileukoproteinase-like n=1 Tax=Diceros bicornis minor TaxID=77932 RepID=UPI0026EBB3BE|nr:antileukoproteinase-like [Diceros bicornis minor]